MTEWFKSLKGEWKLPGQIFEDEQHENTPNSRYFTQVRYKNCAVINLKTCKETPIKINSGQKRSAI